MIGRTLGSYRVVEQIGMGGMATVFKAYDPGTDRYVALKVLPDYYSQDPKFQARFQREAKAIARLEHLHILPVHVYGEDHGTTYLVMRYMPTGTLKERIESGRMPLGEVCRLLGQVASALDYAHRCGVLHRDVKPSNVLLDADNNAYLTDFGIAKMIEGDSELTGSGLLGTPQYMSPEQCEGRRDLTPATDLYSLGVVLYEMVVGQTPYEAETPMAIIHMQLTGAPLPLPRSIRPNLPELVEQVILKALSKDPAERWPTCMGMAEAFAQAVAAYPSSAEPGIASRPGEFQSDTAQLGLRDDLQGTVPRVSAGPAAPATARASRAAPHDALTLAPARRLPAWVFALGGLALVALLAGGAWAAGLLGRPAAAPHVKPTPAPLPDWAITGKGRKVSSCSEDALCVESTDGASARIPLGRAFAAFEGLSWSPDGKQVVFAACTPEMAASTQACSDLFIVDLAGGMVTELPHLAGEAEKLPAWSPSGEWIAYHMSCGVNVVRPDGSEARALTPGGPVAACAEFLAWSPDSRQIAWIGGAGDGNPAHNSRLYVINVDKTGLRKVLDAGDTGLIGNAEGRLAWTPDGKALVAMTQAGEVLQVSLSCDQDKAPCDPAGLPRLQTFPVQWLPTFSPQWGGK